MIQDGLHRLSRVNVNDVLGFKPVQWKSPLYLGLLDYTAGLERLSKITLSLTGLFGGGSFTPVRRYGHRTTDLLDNVEAIELPTGSSSAMPPRPVINQQDVLLPLLERFAVGAGRYENIDFLSQPSQVPHLYEDWCSLAINEPIPEFVYRLIYLRERIQEAIVSASGSVDSSFDFEAIVLNWIDTETEQPVFAESSAVVIQLASLSRWLAEVQQAVSDSLFETLSPAITSKVPYLSEATDGLRLDPEAFFEHVIMVYNSADELEEALSDWHESQTGNP